MRARFAQDDKLFRELARTAERRFSAFYRYPVICSFPPILSGPEEREYRFASGWKRSCRQIEDVDSKSGDFGIGVMRSLPIVDTPVHEARRKQDDAQRFVSWNASGLIVESPAEDLPGVGFF